MTLRPVATDTPKQTASSSTGVVQQFYFPSTVTSDANGNATFTWPAVNLAAGQTIIGSFSCPSAPYTAQFTALNNQSEVYSWQSSNNPGALRATSNMTITVEATGLVKNTTYVMNWVGYSTSSGYAPMIVPESHSDVMITTNQGGLQMIVVNAYPSAIILLAPPAGFAYRIHSLTVYSGGATGVVFILWVASSTGVFFAVEETNTTSYIAQSFLLNGLLIPTGISTQFIIESGSIENVPVLSINYDLIQI